MADSGSGQGRRVRSGAVYQTGADNFTWSPQEVELLAPRYHVLAVETDSFKKDMTLVDPTPIGKYRLTFKVATSTVRNAILAHFKGCYGRFAIFTWSSPPAYVAAAGFSCRYTSYKETPVGKNNWNLALEFEDAT